MPNTLYMRSHLILTQTDKGRGCYDAHFPNSDSDTEAQRGSNPGGGRSLAGRGGLAPTGCTERYALWFGAARRSHSDMKPFEQLNFQNSLKTEIGDG